MLYNQSDFKLEKKIADYSACYCRLNIGKTRCSMLESLICVLL